MKRILLQIAVVFLSLNLFAQMPDGEIAPDWTMTDLNGVEHHLYAYLDSGYTVIIDFSAVWCNPCWNYHNSGSLEELYINHGPAGFPNVSANTTDDVMVFFIEGDEGSIDQLNGNSGGTQGDWVTGTPYPIIPTVGVNNNQVTQDYQIGYWPTIYMICPDRIITENGQISTSQHYEAAQGCPAPGMFEYDAKIIELQSPVGTYCSSSVEPVLTIKNYGSATLTSLNIVSYVDDVEYSSYSWEGSLQQYFTEDITLPIVEGFDNGQYSWKAVLTNPNQQTDEDPSNDTVQSVFRLNSDGAPVQMDILTDNFPQHTWWELTQNDDTVASVTTMEGAQTHHNYDFCLVPDSCYIFTIHDYYHNGMSFGGVVGNVEITWNGYTLLELPGDGFTDQISLEFCIVEPPSSECSFLSYSCEGQTGETNFNSTNKIITFDVPDTIDLTSLIATFTVSEKASVFINDVQQESGVTPNDFTDTLTYTIVAEDSTVANWKVVANQVGTGINSLMYKTLEIYPNPSNGVVFISNIKQGDIVVYDLIGKMVYHETISENKNMIDLSFLNGGTY
ncbi:MAG: T9SS type A sorting domain-containing protein, partial [Chlorobi bacterium]|nr:T9SS type A sorting domain-containing protein [Chlorobiota bacterium]